MAQIARALNTSLDDLLAEAGWLPGPDLTADLGAVAEALTATERRILVNMGRLLQEAREGGVDLRLSPMAAYDRPDPELTEDS